MSTFKIVRFYQDPDAPNRETITTGLTLEQAQAHCQDPETSSSTAVGVAAVHRTMAYGQWFDGWTEET
jgi:hypothetical protein